MNEKEHNDTIGQKLSFYKDNQSIIHVKTKAGSFYNGHVKTVNSNYLILIDRKVGEIIIFFIEIEKVEPYKEEE